MNMITQEQYEELKKYGYYSSFTIWKDWKNISDLSIFDNDNINELLNDRYVFVALNPAEHPNNESRLFQNFHSSYKHQRDFKLCYALNGTKYYGSYITDIFKSFVVTDSKKLPSKIKLEY